MIRTLLSGAKKTKPYISISAQINSKAKLNGKIFVDENISIGHSSIIADENHHININSNATIKDCVLITTKNIYDFEGTDERKVKDIIIGKKVFISSEVTIYGPCVISDDTFVGHGSIIANSNIGPNCVIEEKVVIKNVVIPNDTFIPCKSVINSEVDLNELISQNNKASFCEFYILNNRPLAKVG